MEVYVMSDFEKSQNYKYRDLSIIVQTHLYKENLVNKYGEFYKIGVIDGLYKKELARIPE